MSIDEKDRKLLVLLDIDARMPLAMLAKELRCSIETVNYRIKRLIKKGIIRAFLTEIDVKKIGLNNYIIFVKLNNINSKDYLSFLEYLKQTKAITWIASLGGKFDLAIEITTRSVNEFDEHLGELLEKYSEYILLYEVSTRVIQLSFGKNYLFESDKQPTKLPNNNDREFSIDSFDQLILSELAINSRMSIVDISKKINRPPTSVSHRLRQLEKNKLISGYRTFCSMELLGYSKFKALIKMKNFDKKSEIEFLSYCVSHPNITYFTKALGGWNVEIDVDVASPTEYQQFMIGIRNKFEYIIQDLESLVIFDEHKWTFWPR